MIKKIKNGHFLPLFLLIIFCLPVIYPYFKPHAINTYDTIYRLTRAAKYYVAVRQLQIPPRWIGDTYHGVGEPIFVYLYPFPYMISTLLYIIDFSFVDALKIPWIIFYLGSAITMFMFLTAFFSPLASFAGSLLYIWAPYRMVQLYVRGAYEETINYFFFPLIFLSIWLIYQGKKYGWVLGAFFLGLAILSQSAIALMFLPSIVTFAFLCLTWKVKKRVGLLKDFSLMFFTGVLLSSMTILPNMFERHLIQLDEKIANIYEKNFIPIDRLIHSPWTMIPTPHMLGKAHIFVLLFAVVLLVYRLVKGNRGNKGNKGEVGRLGLSFFLFALVWSFVPLLLSVESPLARFVWEHILVVRVVYVPYLFLQLAIFWIAFLTASLIEQFKKARFFLAALFIFITIITNISYIKPDYYFPITDYDLTGFDGPLSQFEEFLPKTAAKAGDQFARGEIVVFQKETTESKLLEKQYHKIKLRVEAIEEDTLTIHQLYFPGWKAFINGNEIPISYTQPPINIHTGRPVSDAGLMTISIPSGKHELLLTFKNTTVRSLSNILSLATLIFLMVFCLRKHLRV